MTVAFVMQRDLIVLGGAFYTAGNVNPAAEANFYGDPLAADIVLGASEHIKVSVIWSWRSSMGA